MGKRPRQRKKFGQPCGRHSRSHRLSEKKACLKQEEKIRLYMRDKSRYMPYQIVKQQQCSKGRLFTKITVRRIPVLKDRTNKLLQLGNTSLKFKIHSAKKLNGNRIINLDNLKQYVCDITTHCCMCVKAQNVALEGKNPLVLHSEMKSNGLYSVLRGECKGCGKMFDMESSPKHPNGNVDINVRAVWGSVSSGCGSSDLNEILSTMDIPPMNETKFTSLEEEIGGWWHDTLEMELAKAAAEEKRIAVQKNQFNEGIPAITVICDGGWSKRTHKHTYNASGGVAVIFGAETKKLLHIGVRNKYCVVCRRAENAKTTPGVHNCYKNWNESSQAMESDIILDGFLKAESQHGLRYTQIIADGDSSVYTTLQEKVPVWGKDIKKLECANHSCKCLRSNLEKLVCEKPHYKGKGKLTKHVRVRLTTAIRCAIKMRSKTKDVHKLKHDIINSIYHIFGFHSRCNDFCKKSTSVNKETENEKEPILEPESFDSIFNEQEDYWTIPSDSELESSRVPVKNQIPLQELKEIIEDVQVFLNRLANRCNRLIGNFTTNLAESWMSIRSKFDGGKVVNRCSRGSWETRCYGGALRKNLGSAWSPMTFQTVTSMQAGDYFHKGAKRQLQKLLSAKKYKEKPESKVLRNKRKLFDVSVATTKKAKQAYGTNLDDSADIESNELKKLCDSFVKTHFSKTNIEIHKLQQETIQQSKSELWKRERRIRLTSSNFGQVVLRRPQNVSTCIVKNHLYSNFKGNINTIKGLTEENNAIIEYKNVKGNIEVERTGLRICSEHQFLGASTDGIVFEKCGNNINKGLLEIKNFLQNNQFIIKEAVNKVPQFCLKHVSGQLELKKTHSIYFQIQGQLNIFDMDWCDFVLRRTNPYDIFIQRIPRDKNLWNTTMLPKLEDFYMKFILPELVFPRYGTCSGIRQPVSPWFIPHSNQKPSQKQHTPRPVTQSSSQLKETKPKSPVPSTSQTPDTPEPLQSSSRPTRSKRSTTVKFLGRQILHEWEIDEETKETKWYTGLVTDVVRGKDGHPGVIYNVYYKEDDTSYEIEDLIADYSKGSVKFKDL